MNNLLDIKTPAQAQAAALQERLRPRQPRPAQPAAGLLEPPDRGALRGDRVPRARRASRRQGRSWSYTGKHTARSANDKFIVREADLGGAHLVGRVQPPVQPRQVRRALSAGCWGTSRAATCSCRTASAGADPTYRLPIRDRSPSWPGTACSPGTCSCCRRRNEEYRRHVPEFTVICASRRFKGVPAGRRHGVATRSSS